MIFFDFKYSIYSVYFFNLFLFMDINALHYIDIMLKICLLFNFFSVILGIVKMPLAGVLGFILLLTFGKWSLAN